MTKEAAPRGLCVKYQPNPLDWRNEHCGRMIHINAVPPAFCRTSVYLQQHIGNRFIGWNIQDKRCIIGQRRVTCVFWNSRRNEE
jgi:hypothetical protein